MIDALAILKTELARSFSGAPLSPASWSDPEEITRARKRVYHDHGGAAIVADSRSIMAAIADFERSGVIKGFRDLKYVCLGIGALDEEGWSVLADELLRGKVARTIEQQSAAHRRLRCFQALLFAYFSFPINGQEASEESKTGWRGLRGWLRAERDRLIELLDFKPPWFETLLRHAELLTSQPCNQFGADLLRGDAAGLNEAREGLSIPETSWVIEEAVLAQMRAAAALEDAPFKAVLPDLLAIAMGRVGVSISEMLKTRCVAQLVSRYARCVDRPEQPALRDASTSTIGNPWLRKDRWDVNVRVGKQADDLAREMVSFWLKERLVADFFELLSADEINDKRRVAYWLRFVPFVEDMWFALGPAALESRDIKFSEFRARAKGRLLRLEGSGPENNAFVMRIGGHLAVEFGESNHAFYLFRWNALAPSLLQSLNSGRASAEVHVKELKRDDNEDKMSHRDSPVALKSWEQKFDDKLIKLIGKKPETRPACVPDLEVLFDKDRVKVSDLRAAGGALWVYEEERSSYLARRLQSKGFAYRAGRGWFKE
ncbi:EH signature domain-containing protein [Paraburkholderia ferrariae]|uniref:EH signature domain-containing protein n=1 Tax=Paraburkholderia ferrariae TaxID=386056 RepID=UPI000487C885|nr:EH signature domain-containing protein [Paraburkholderia ferrariae]